MAPHAVIWHPIVIRLPGNCVPLSPLVTPLRSRGHFRYGKGKEFVNVVFCEAFCERGVETAKRFVNVHLHHIVSNMERISKISSFPPGKDSADARASDLIFFKFLAVFRHVLVVSYLQIPDLDN